MTRAEIRFNLKALGGALALVLFVLGAQGLVDRLERDHEDRLSYRDALALLLAFGSA